MRYLLGYRDKRINLFRTKLKPLGYLVATLGFIFITIAIIPNGLGFIAYPLGFTLLSLVGIKFSVRDIYNKFECTRRFL